MKPVPKRLRAASRRSPGSSPSVQLRPDLGRETALLARHEETHRPHHACSSFMLPLTPPCASASNSNASPRHSANIHYIRPLFPITYRRSPPDPQNRRSIIKAAQGVPSGSACPSERSSEASHPCLPSAKSKLTAVTPQNLSAAPLSQARPSPP